MGQGKSQIKFKFGCLVDENTVVRASNWEFPREPYANHRVGTVCEMRNSLSLWLLRTRSTCPRGKPPTFASSDINSMDVVVHGQHVR